MNIKFAIFQQIDVITRKSERFRVDFREQLV